MNIKLYNCLGKDEAPESEYSIGLGYLKTNCFRANIEIVTDRAELVNCDMIGLSAVTEGIREAVEILESTSIPVIIGGQCTLWEDLKDYPFAHIIYGEGEMALQSIIDGPKSAKRMKYENIPNLDILNYPDRGRCKEVVPIVTSRGCPWNCYFCSSQNYWGKPRYHSANYFLAEVDHLLGRYQDANLLYILDDLFIANKARFLEIYEGWMRGGFYKQLKLKGFVRSNLMNLRTAKMLKAMGFVSVRFGAESGSNRMLELLNKKTTVEDHQRCIDICNKVGLPVCYSLMSFLPGETIEDRQKTGAFVQHNIGKSYICGNYSFRPFPGTKYYNGENPLECDWRTRGGSTKKKENKYAVSK